MYLYRAVDKQGKTVESYLSRTREVTAAKAFFRKALKRHGRAESNYPGWFRAHPAALSRMGINNAFNYRWDDPVQIRNCPYLNNEFAQQSTQHSSWADQFYRRKRQRGKSHQSAIRALAFKLIRITYACWKANKPYDESFYLQALEKRNFSVSST
jgi:transposase-like protein